MPKYFVIHYPVGTLACPMMRKKRFKFIVGEFLSRGRPSEVLPGPLKTPNMKSFATIFNGI